MNNQATPAGAIVRHSTTTLRFATGDLAKAEYVDAKLLDVALARIAELEKPVTQYQAEPFDLRFPTAPDERWTGAQVNQFLRDMGPLYRNPRVLQGDSATLQKVYDVFNIGDLARNPSTLLVCLGNIKRYSDYLAAVEREFFMVPGQPSEEPDDEGCEPDDECLVSRWPARSVEHYVEQFRTALATLAKRGELAGYLRHVDTQYPEFYPVPPSGGLPLFPCTAFGYTVKALYEGPMPGMVEK